MNILLGRVILLGGLLASLFRVPARWPNPIPAAPSPSS